MKTYDILFVLGRKSSDIGVNNNIPENGMFYQANVPALGTVSWLDRNGRVGEIKVHLHVEVKWYRDVRFWSFEEFEQLMNVIRPDSRYYIKTDAADVEKAVRRLIRARAKAGKEVA